MKKDSVILILGIIVAFVAYFQGVPQKWETIILTTSGLLIALFAFLHRRDLEGVGTDPHSSDTFSQNGFEETERYETETEESQT